MFSQEDFFYPDDQQRSHLCDAGTWSHKEVIVTPLWQVAADISQCALTTPAYVMYVKLQVYGSMVTLFPTRTIESASIPIVAQMAKKDSTGRQKESNSKV